MKQIGNLGILLLALQCRDAKWLPFYLRVRLPYFMEEQAEKLAWFAGCVSLDDEESGEAQAVLSTRRDPEAERDMVEFEARDVLERALGDDLASLDLVYAIRLGYTHRELASYFGITRQAVGARIRKLATRLDAVLKPEEDSPAKIRKKPRAKGSDGPEV